MCSADPGVAFSIASTALNEVTRLEEVRSDSTAENWEELLSGLSTVITSAARLADRLGDHLARAKDQAGWRAGDGPTDLYPGEILSATGESVRQMSDQLVEVSRLIAVSRDQVALLHLSRKGERRPSPGV